MKEKSHIQELTFKSIIESNESLKFIEITDVGHVNLLKKLRDGQLSMI